GILNSEVTVTASGAFASPNVGSYNVDVTYTLVGNELGNYVLDPASETFRALITPASFTVDFSDAAVTYDGAGHSITVDQADLEDGDVVLYSLDAENYAAELPAFTDAGTYKVYAKVRRANHNDWTGSANLTINPLQLEISDTAVTAKPYDGTTAATVVAGELTNLVSGDDVTVTADGEFPSANVGTWGVAVSYAISGADASNYLAPVSETVNGEIYSATGDYSFTGGTVVYDGAQHGFLLSGTQAGDTITYTYGGKTYTEMPTFKNAGTYEVSVTVSRAGYTDWTGSATLEITKRDITVSGTTADDKVYDGTTDATIHLGVVSGIVEGEEVDVVYTGLFRSADVGDYTIVFEYYLYGDDDVLDNYNLATDYETDTASITKATITVTGAKVTDRAYDRTTDAEVTGYTLSGVVAGDTVSVTATGQFDTADAGLNKAVTATYTLDADSAANYELEFTTQTLSGTILKKEVTVSSLDVKDKVYDTTTDAEIVLGDLDGKVAGDEIAVVATGAFTSANVGNYDVTVTYALTGAAAGNYVLTEAYATDAAAITARPVTVSGVTANDKVYDGTAAATIASMTQTGLITGDAVTFNYEGNFDTKNVGDDKDVTFVFSLSGDAASNYDLQTLSATSKADITPRTVYVFGASVENKVYDGTTDAVISGAVLLNAIDGDDVAASGATAFTGKDAGRYNDLTVTFTLEGTDAGNYVVSSETATQTLSAEIYKRQLTITGTYADDKIYDGNTNAAVHADPDKLGNLVDGETVTLTAGGTFDTPNPGENKDVTVTYSVDDANYYAPVSEIVKATIFPGDMGITFDDAAFVYNAEAHSITVSGKQEGDTVLYSVDGQSYSVTVPEYTDAGEYTIYAKVQRAGYPEWNGSATLTVTPAKATLTFTAEDKVYDGSAAIDVANNKITGTFSGLVGGESIAITINSASFDGKDAGEHAIANVDYVYATPADAATAANYTIDVVMGSAEIKKAEATLTFTPEGKTYDGSVAVTALDYGFDGLVTGEDIELIIASAAFDSKNAGERTLETVNYGYADIADAMTAANYAITVVENSAVITPLAIELNFEASDKAYDGTTAATVVAGSFEFVTLIDGDTVTVVSYTAQFDTAEPGADKTVSLTAVEFDGADKDNYDITVNDATASILGPEAASMIVTTDQDVVDPFDNLISLREALTVYFKKAEGGAVTGIDANGNYTYDADASNRTVTFESSLGRMRIDAANVTDSTAFVLGTSYTLGTGTYAVDYDGLTINGDEHISFESEPYRIFSVTAAADITFDGLLFKNISTSEDGAAISIASGLGSAKTVTVVDSDFIGNRASNGGAIYAGSLNLTVNRSLFESNDVEGGDGEGSGGAIYNAGANLTITGGEFTFNHADNDGGAIWTATNLTITGGSFMRNDAALGGAVYAVSGTTLTVSDSDFTRNRGQGGALSGDTIVSTGNIYGGNTATYAGGGAIYAVTVTSTRDTFSSNTSNIGGAIYGTTVNVTDSSFTGNKAVKRSGNTGDGGAIYVLGTGADSCVLSDAVFSRNSAEGNGGAVYGSYIVSTNGTYTANTAAGDGGAIYAGHVKSTDDTFTRNTASNNGGAIYSDSDTTVIVDGSYFGANTAGQNGGAIYGLTVSVTDGSFVNNSAAVGGAIYSDKGTSVTAIDSVFTGNTAENGGGIYLFETAALTLTNVEMTRNKATDGDGGAVYGDYVDAAARMTVTDSGFAGNRADKGDGGAIAASDVTVLNVSGSTFTDNSALEEGSGRGGAIFLLYGDVADTQNISLAVADSTFTGNTAADEGGAIYTNAEAVLTVTGSGFSKNTAANGGAIWAGAVSVTDGTFEENKAVGKTETQEVTRFDYVDDPNGDYTYDYYEQEYVLISELDRYSYDDDDDEYVLDNENGEYVFDTYWDEYVLPEDLEEKYTLETSTGEIEVTIGGNGGAIYGTKLTITDADFTSNETNGNGGAIYGTTINVTDSTFDGNKATGVTIVIPGEDEYEYDNDGDYVFGDYDDSGEDKYFLISELTKYRYDADLGEYFQDDSGDYVYEYDYEEYLPLASISKYSLVSGDTTETTGGSGGAIFADALEVIDSIFSDNTATNYGGAIVADALDIADVIFRNNAATEWDGGAVYGSLRGGAVKIERGTFENNSAYEGGALAAENGGEITVTDSSFIGNTAEIHGGAIYSDNIESITLNGIVFRGNISESNGGAVYAVKGNTITVTDSTFTGNEAEISGGAFYVQDVQTLEISNGTFDGNKVTDGNFGGAICYESDYIDHITIADSAFTNNRAVNGDGGALRFFNSSDNQAQASVTISNTLFRGNSASGDGGAIEAVDIDLTVNYSRIVENSAGTVGGGINIYRSSLTVYQSLIADNTAEGNGGGIYIYDKTALNLSWSTVAGNSGVNGSDLCVNNNASASVTASYSIVLDAELMTASSSLNYVDTLYEAVVPNSGTFTPDADCDILQPGDSLFLGGSDIETKYTLADGSVAIDGTGLNPEAWKDLADVTRPIGASADYGAYEYTGNRIVGLTVPYNGQAQNLVKLDGTVVSAQYSADGVNWSDSLTYRNAGTYPIYVRYTDVDDNTEIVRVVGEITPLTITVSDTAVADKRFDGTTDAQITYDWSGKLDGDTVTVNASGAFPSYKPGTYDVDVTFSLSGADAVNYTVTPESVTDQAEITGAEDPSMRVTTDLDVVDAYDGLISLREALTVYYQTDGTMTYNSNGTITYGKDTANKTVTFEDSLGTMRLDSGFDLGSAHDYDGLVIRGTNDADQANHIAFDGASFSVFTVSKAANIEFNNLIFRNNTVSGGGSAINVLRRLSNGGQTVSVNDCEFTGNTGAIRVQSLSAAVTGSTFTSNTAEAGAAIYARYADSITVDGSEFNGNRGTGNSDASGGAVFVQGVALTVRNSSFSKNVAPNAHGAAVHAMSATTVVIEDSVFNKNTSANEGGAVRFATSSGSASIKISRSRFTENETTRGDGGAVYLYGMENSGTVTDSVFDSNTASGNGGALWFGDVDLTVAHSSLTNNTANGGGAIYVRNNSLTLNYSRVTGNSSTGGDGGGIYAEDGSSHTVYQSLIAGNTADGKGGGIYLYNRSALNMSWSTVAGNTASEGNDLYSDSNTNHRVNGSILLEAVVQNGKFYYTKSLYETALPHNPAYSVSTYFDFDDCTVYQAGQTLFTGGDDIETKYTLADGSVAINATGISETTGNPTSDLAGNTRPIGAAYDYGAFEYQRNRVYGLTHVYDGQQQELVAIDSTVATVEYSTDGGQTWNSTVPTAKNVGDYTVQVRFTTTDDEIETLTVTGRITPLRLTISGSAAANKPYDGNTTASVTPGQLTNKASGDDVAVAVKTASFDTPDVGANKPVAVTYEITGDAAANYIEPAEETLRAAINPATITDVTVSGWEGVYDGSGHSITVTDPSASTDTILYSTDGVTYDLTENPA
ncbi:MAG: hypothetical protein IKE69_03020, partial [Thermoguttaceae bacterium]|nr:hypothetical protein [Thermoguttaceae bacterium]